MAATRIIIRPNYLFGCGLISFILSRARARASSPKGLSSDDSPRSIIIEMTIYRGGRILTPPGYVFDAVSRDFSTSSREGLCQLLCPCTRGWKKRRIGATVERRVEKSRGFRPARLSLRSCLYSGSTRVPREIVLSVVLGPKTSFRRSARRKTSLYQFDRDKSCSEADSDS